MRLSRSLRSFWSTEIWCREVIALAVLLVELPSLPDEAAIPFLACCAIASLLDVSMATCACSVSWLCLSLLPACLASSRACCNCRLFQRSVFQAETWDRPEDELV